MTTELPTDAIDMCIENKQGWQFGYDPTETAKQQLQALLDEIKRFRDECTDCPFCTPLTKQGGKQ